MSPGEARTLYVELGQELRPRPLMISALVAWWYRGGPWEIIARFPFR